MTHPKNLIDYGQSYWLDNLSREMLDSGELAENIRAQGLRGMTSNPKIFEKAMGGGSSYDAEIRKLVKRRLSIGDVYESLAVSDVRRACDLFRSVYEESGGRDGFVSLEVSPYLAHDTPGTMKEARRLFASVDRPNVMIKIPGTVAGLDAIEEMLFEGVNVNITLLFSVERYQAVAERYLRALERRLHDGRSLDQIASVASFFLSRIDVLADRLLGQRIVSNGANGRPPETLFGELAIARARLAYRSFQQIFSGARFARLSERGASVQRLLWASTSTKNPCYSDVRYVEPLIGKETVNTMPRRTIEAFADHGVIREDSLEEDFETAELIEKELAALGVDIRAITWQLEHEGVAKFIAPFDQLMGNLAAKYRRLVSVSRQDLGSRRPPDSESMMQALREMQLGRRLYAKNPWLWTREPSEAERISNRLGWLTCVDRFRDRTRELLDFAGASRSVYDRVLLLGMGGSSLAASVCAETFGSRPGFPELRVLDSTNPTEVERAERWVEAGRCLFVVASKSGTTSETISLYRYFYERVHRDRGDEARADFVVITDPGTPLADEAHSKGFRSFENPPDIGGRYSALSYFGLVPMALMGIDLEELLSRALDLRLTSGPEPPVESNPALALGVVLAAAAVEGRDKITFVPGESADAFALWAEQLLAESTGKHGKGLIPIVDEPLGQPDDYGDDRIFVAMRVGSRGRDAGGRLEVLEAAGHPVVRIQVAKLLDIGAEFLRWELATATVGAVLGINPFDEPNVEESKQNTRRLLEEWKGSERFEEGEPIERGEQIAIYADDRHDWVQDFTRNGPLSDTLESFFRLGRAGDYLSLLAYLPFSPEAHKQLQMLRLVLRDRLLVGTTLAYGPRYLHSTGQLHKGGPDKGLYLILTAEPETSRAIPGEGYGFETLLEAQALGDFRALNERGRRVLRVHFRGSTEKGLAELMTAVLSEARLARAR